MNVRLRDRDRGPIDPVRWAESSYLGRNIAGMMWMLDDLLKLKMAFHAPPPAWPTPPFDSYEEHVGWSEEIERSVGITPEGREHVRRCEVVRSTHSECGTPGIPTFKFSSNDGWHVTRDECAQALGLYHDAMLNGAQHPRSFGDDVVPFIRLGVDEDGFEVW